MGNEVEGSSGGIGSATIDPDAEKIAPSDSSVSARQEVGFYEEARVTFLLEQRRQELGMLGKFFGASAAPTNIAGLAIFAALVLVAGSFMIPQTPDLVDARKWLYGTITTALGYLFGAATKK